MTDFLPILILLVVVTIVIARLPKIDLGHSKSFFGRRAITIVTAPNKMRMGKKSVIILPPGIYLPQLG